MSTEAATVLVYAVLAYAAAGVAFALPFVWIGAARIDPAAAHATFGFRVLVLPGAAALWPILFVRWLRNRSTPAEHGPHRAAASAPGKPGKGERP